MSCTLHSTEEENAKETERMRTARSKAEYTMGRFISATGKTIRQLRELSAAELDEAFEGAWEVWKPRMYPKCTEEKLAALRKGKLSISRIDALMRQYEKRARNSD